MKRRYRDRGLSRSNAAARRSRSPGSIWRIRRLWGVRDIAPRRVAVHGYDGNGGGWREVVRTATPAGSDVAHSCVRRSMRELRELIGKAGTVKNDGDERGGRR